jgi:predicted PurR-regulated permease PerM
MPAPAGALESALAMSEKDANRSDLPFVGRVLIVVAVGALVAAVWLLSDVLLLLFGSILLAVTLRALAAPLITYLKIGDRWAVAIVGLLLLAALSAFAVMFGPDLWHQVQVLTDRLSQAMKMMGDRFQIGSITDLLKGGNPTRSLGAIVASVFAWSSTLLGGMADLVLVLFGGLYLAIDPGLYRAGLIKLVPPSVQPNIQAALDDAGEALRRWLGAQMTAMVLVGTLTGTGFWLVGLPSPVALGVIMGLAEFIPFVGPIVAAIAALLLAAAQDWNAMLWALGVIIVVQQLESNVIMPLVVGSTVAIAPAVALFAIVCMGVLFGPLGLLFGFPLAIVFDIAVRRLYVLDTLGERVDIMGHPAKRT